jgi:serine/threonine protein kinase
MGELIIRIINGQIEDIADVFSLDIKQLVQEMLDTDCDKRPSINEILQKPFILRYIKLNLIKQMDLNQSTKENTKESIKDDDEYLENKGLIDIEDITFKKEENLIIEDSRYKKEESDDNTRKNILDNEKEETLDYNSTFYKIEKTKKFLEKLMGFDNFVLVYSKITVKRLFLHLIIFIEINQVLIE